MSPVHLLEHAWAVAQHYWPAIRIVARRRAGRQRLTVAVEMTDGASAEPVRNEPR